MAVQSVTGLWWPKSGPGWSKQSFSGIDTNAQVIGKYQRINPRTTPRPAPRPTVLRDGTGRRVTGGVR